MKADTRTRIMDAAEAAFGRSGYLGATTQEIARAAEVNEVTLFRHFGTKELLFAALIGRFIEGRAEILNQAVAEHAPMEATLTRFAECHHRMLAHSAPFIRTLLGESSRHPQEVKKVIEEMAKPLRERMIGLFGQWQAEGRIRPDVNCEAALDLFSALFFGQAIKPSHCSQIGYSAEEYRALCVEVFIRGLRP